MNQTEWLTDVGQAAQDLGYGIESIGPSSITLLGRQDKVRITIDSYLIGGAFLRERLQKIEHRSGWSTTIDYDRLTRERGR